MEIVVFDENSPFIKEFAAIVDGNHDQGFFPLTATLPTALGNILITHGHKFNVYAGYDYLVEYMNKADIHICFHGHTHVHIMKYIRIKYLLILVVLCLIEGNLNVEAMLLYLLMINFMLIFLTQEHKKNTPIFN